MVVCLESGANGKGSHTTNNGIIPCLLHRRVDRLNPSRGSLALGGVGLSVTASRQFPVRLAQSGQFFSA
jgi:hypothetical protein